MKLSRRAKLAIAGALLVTLGGKAASLRPAVPSNTPLFAEHAEQLLRAHGFSTWTEQHPFGAVIYGQSGACRMMLADYPPHGTLREPLAMLVQPIGSLRYVWRGEVRDAAPKIVPLVSFFIERELRRIGLGSSRRPLIAAAASPACDVGGIDWNVLATLPA